jgi:magnesium-transporting ATPase (P-type)
VNAARARHSAHSGGVPSPAANNPIDQRHASAAATVAAALRVDPARGLAPDDAARRLVRSGPNALPEVPVPSLGWLVLGQFRSPLVLALAVAAAVSAAIGDTKDSAMIAGILLASRHVSAAWRRRRCKKPGSGQPPCSGSSLGSPAC